MKHVFFCILAFTFSLSISAQTDISVVGLWHVEKAIIPQVSLSSEEMGKVKEFVSAFEKSSFNFEANGKFVMDFPIKDLQIPDGKWSYNAQSRTIKITEAADEKSIIMMIMVEKDNTGNMYFTIEESPLKLKMIKRSAI